VHRESYDQALLTGDVYYTCLSILHYKLYSFFAGRSLIEQEKELKVYAPHMAEFNFPDPRMAYLDICMVNGEISASKVLPSDLLRYLEIKDRNQLLERIKNGGSEKLIQNGHFYSLILNFYFKKYNEAATWASAYHGTSAERDGSFIGPTDVYHTLYEGLNAFQLARDCPKEHYNSWMKIGQYAISFFEKLAKHSVWNWENKLLLLQAELEFLNDNKSDAIELYEAAIKSGKQHRFIHEEGLAFEMLGLLYQHYGEINQAKIQMTNARKCYKKWGAYGIIDIRTPMHQCMRE
jgi:tetratricopeptide (TPR) repeat protein